MNYTILIYESSAEFAARTSVKEPQADWAAWPPFSKVLKDAGVFVSGAGFLPPETATTVRVHGGHRQLTDGPYADTAEQLGGFFVINVPNLDEALRWAARCPRPAGRVVEVRPNMPAVN